MGMYKQQPKPVTTLKRNTSVEGETIEQKVERIVNNKEPITDGAPIIFQERKEGVQAAYDVRTDRWEIAVDAMDKVAQDSTAKREARIVDIQKKKEGDSEAKPTQGQSDNNSNQPSK